jgi:ribosomal protein L21
MKYAVMSLNGKQQIVNEGDELLVDHIKEPHDLKVLLVAGDDGKVEIGYPYLSNKVTIKVVGEKVKGDKIISKTFKSKSRLRKKIGFTPQYSKIKIVSIT